MNDSYVYFYVREDGTPYYVGKGRLRRAYDRRNNHHTPLDLSRIVFVSNKLSDLQARAIEIFWIKVYGRKDLGTGILLNRTDGGEGSTGRIFSHTVESKEKLRLANLGKKKGPLSAKGCKNISKSLTGRKLSQSTKDKISAARQGKPRPRGNCTHCGVEMDVVNLNRYHNDKCKLR